MPWSGWPTTPVSQLTFTEWQLALRPGREALVGYTLRWMGVWHVFGDDRWVWFNGVIPGSRGAVEIVTQWAEAENLGTSHRHWRWVHWRNPSKETVFVAPRFVLAPPLDDRDLRTTDQDTRHKRIWTIADVASTGVHGFGAFLPPDDGDSGGAGGGAGGAEGMPADERRILTGMRVRTLADQRLRTIELRGDERFVPLDELDGRIDHLYARGDDRRDSNG